MLRSDLCDYSNAYIVVKGEITIKEDYNKRNKKQILKSNFSFRSILSKINSTFIDNADDLDIVILMSNWLECSENYPMTSGS